VRVNLYDIRDNRKIAELDNIESVPRTNELMQIVCGDTIKLYRVEGVTHFINPSIWDTLLPPLYLVKIMVRLIEESTAAEG